MGFLLLIAVLGCIPGAIASSKGRSFFGWWLYGALLFIVALIHSLCISKDHKVLEKEMISEGLVKCPYCAEMVKPEAIKCRHCGSDIEPTPLNLVPKSIDRNDGVTIRFDRILILVVGAFAVLIFILNQA